MGLLKAGKENCCLEPKIQAVQQVIFKNEEAIPDTKNDVPQQLKDKKETLKETAQTKEKEEKKSGKTKKKPSLISIFDGWTDSFKKTAKDFVDNATKEEDDYITDDEEDKN